MNSSCCPNLHCYANIISYQISKHVQWTLFFLLKIMKSEELLWKTIVDFLFFLLSQHGKALLLLLTNGIHLSRKYRKKKKTVFIWRHSVAMRRQHTKVIIKNETKYFIIYRVTFSLIAFFFSQSWENERRKIRCPLLFGL